MNESTYIGLDLAWSERNPTGVAIARGSVRSARLVELCCHDGDYEALARRIAKSASAEMVVAVDAPLVVPNHTGQRGCESEITKRFGSRHAGAHSSNRAKFANGGPPVFEDALERQGFSHGVGRNGLITEGRRMVEVYPHPAIVMLFDLLHIIRYKSKKGRSLDDQRAGLVQLRKLLASLENADPAFDPGELGREFVAIDLGSLRGKALKAYEDQLDAWMCAYLALHIARWGDERNEIFGDVENGYVVVPSMAVEFPSKSVRGLSTQIGFINRNGQKVMEATGRPGTDHLQKIYMLECGECRWRYGANGSDIHLRKCPECQSGRPGIW